MIEALSVTALFGGTFSFIVLGVYLGTSHIKRVLASAPIEANKPIVLPVRGEHPERWNDQFR